MIGDSAPLINNCIFERVFVVKSSDVRIINGKEIKMRRGGDESEGEMIDDPFRILRQRHMWYSRISRVGQFKLF